MSTPPNPPRPAAANAALDDAQETVVLRTPGDMARLLLASCPQQAAGFAGAAQERASWALDEERIAFWDSVARLLASLAGGPAVATPQAPHHA
jgi:hypothetical protein